MPFGLTNAPASLQRVMYQLFKDLIRKSCCVYLDDGLICSETFEEHVLHIEEVFIRYACAGLKADPKKTELCLQEVLFLRHILSANGIRPYPEKTAIIWKIPIPVTLTDVRSFLGISNYYRRFVPEMAAIVQPIQKRCTFSVDHGLKVWMLFTGEVLRMNGTHILRLPACLQDEWTVKT